jgi:hypothetical protein
MGQPDAEKTQEHDCGRPDIRGKVKCIRFQGLAFVLFGYPAEHGGTVHIYQQGDGHYGKSPPGEGNLRLIVEQTVHSLPDNPGAGN